MSLAAVTLGDLVELIWVSLVVTLTLITAFAFGIRGSSRAADLRREGRGSAALPHAALAIACYGLVAAACVAAVLVIATG